jgi:hypothetical protein
MCQALNTTAYVDHIQNFTLACCSKMCVPSKAED